MQTKDHYIEITLSIIIGILLIILLVQILTGGGFSACDKCRFDYEGKTIRTNKLLSIYERECFSQSDFSNLLNQTVNKSP